MAKYILENIEQDSYILMQTNDAKCTPVYAYVESINKDIVFYDLNNEEIFKYYDCGQHYEELDYNKIMIIADKMNMKKVYYLSYSKKEDFKLVYEVTDSLWGEDYFLYKLGD